MTEEEDSSNAPSAASTDEGTAETEEVTMKDAEEEEEADEDDPQREEIVDRSGEPGAEEKAIALKDQGNAELSKGHYLQAIELYSIGLQYRPTNAILLSNRALAYIKVENYGLAQIDADRAIEADPSYAKGYYRRASASFALNHFKAARKDFRQVCKLKPKDRDARAKLSACEKVIREEAFFKAIEAEQSAPLSSTYDPNLIDIPASYDGPHPSPEGAVLADAAAAELEASLFEPGKLPREFVMAAVQHFKDRKLIHKRYVARLLLSCRKYFSELSSLMEIPIPNDPPAHDPTASPRLTVCGDTHGQFYDVLNIFETNGYPDLTNPYLFNGDFVDRGSFSFEVVTTYLLFKLHNPNCIFLTRGNHETKNMVRLE